MSTRAQRTPCRGLCGHMAVVVPGARVAATVTDVAAVIAAVGTMIFANVH